MKKFAIFGRSSFATKIILPMVITILIFGSLTALLVARLVYNQLLNKEKNQLSIVAMEQAHESSIVLSRTQVVIDQIAILPETLDYLSSAKPKIQDENLLDLFNDFNVGKSFSSIYLLDASGSAVVSTDPKFIGQNYSFRQYFKQSMDGKRGFDVAVGVTTGMLGHYLSAPVVVEGQVKGVLVGKMDPNLLLAEIDTNEKEESSYLGLERFMTDEYGVIVFSGEEDRLYASLGVLSESLLNAEMRKKRYAKEELMQLQYQKEMDAVLQQQEFTQREFLDELDQEREIVTLAKVGGYPLYVVMEMNLRQINNSVIQVISLIGAVVVFAALFTALVVAGLVTLWLKPLKKMRQIAMNVAAGNFSERIDNLGDDELGDLGRSFNEMANSLVIAKENVEEQVRSRTEELTRLNKFMIGRELKMAELKKQINEVKNEKK